MAFRLFKRGLKKYEQILRAKPFTTTITTNAIIVGLGEVLKQYIVKYNSTQEERLEWKFNTQHLNTMLIYGVGYSCLFSYHWYTNFLPRLTQSKDPSKIKMTLKKTFLDQTVNSGLADSTFLYFMTRLNGGDHDDAIEKHKKDFLRIFIMDQKVWIIVQLFNFYYIPIRYQIFVVSIISVFWSAYLSFVQHVEEV